MRERLDKTLLFVEERVKKRFASVEDVLMNAVQVKSTRERELQDGLDWLKVARGGSCADCGPPRTHGRLRWCSILVALLPAFLGRRCLRMCSPDDQLFSFPSQKKNQLRNRVAEIQRDAFPRSRGKPPIASPRSRQFPQLAVPWS